MSTPVKAAFLAFSVSSVLPAKSPLAATWPEIFCYYVNHYSALWAAHDAYSNGGDVGEIGSHTGGVDHIEEGKLVDVGRDLAEERQRLFRSVWVPGDWASEKTCLSNATRGT